MEMLGFATAKGDVTAAPGAAGATWELKMLPLDQIHAEAQLAAPPPKPVVPPAPAPSEKKPSHRWRPTGLRAPRDQLAQQDPPMACLLINGSQNNGASSPFALFPAFGNNRNGGRSLYNGSKGIFVDNSIWDARQFSITGRELRPSRATTTSPVQLISAGRSKFLTCSEEAPTSSSAIGGCAAATTRLAPRSCRRRRGAWALFRPSLIIPKSEIDSQALALLNLLPVPKLFKSGRL